METVTENRFSMDNQRAFVTPADNPPMKEDRVFEEEEEESSGQIVGTSARVTRQVFYPDPHRRSPSSVPTVKRASQPVGCCMLIVSFLSERNFWCLFGLKARSGPEADAFQKVSVEGSNARIEIRFLSRVETWSGD